MRKRTLTCTAIAMCLVLMTVGCRTARPRREQVRKLPAYAIPSAKRPIVFDFESKPYGLVFGGPDGSKRIHLARTDSMAITATSHTGTNQRAAVLYVDREKSRKWIVFYDVEARPVATVDLPEGLMVFDEPKLWVSDRNEAVVSMVRHAVYPPHLAAALSPYPYRPAKPLVPRVAAHYYVAPEGTVHELQTQAIHYLWFTKTPGFAMFHGNVRSGHEALLKLERYDSKLCVVWSARVKAWNPLFRQPEEGFEVSVSVPRALIHFRPDGTYEAEEEVFDPEAFARGNPGHKERVGSGYEKKYLGAAVEELARAASLTRREKREARAILRTFIYDSLESFVTGGSKKRWGDFDANIARADESFRALLNEDKYEAYMGWRVGEPKQKNPLGFLMLLKTIPPVDLDSLVVPSP